MLKSTEGSKQHALSRELHACLPLVSLNLKSLPKEAVQPLLSNHKRTAPPVGWSYFHLRVKEIGPEEFHAVSSIC